MTVVYTLEEIKRKINIFISSSKIGVTESEVWNFIQLNISNCTYQTMLRLINQLRTERIIIKHHIKYTKFHGKNECIYMSFVAHSNWHQKFGSTKK